MPDDEEEDYVRGPGRWRGDPLPVPPAVRQSIQKRGSAACRAALASKGIRFDEEGGEWVHDVEGEGQEGA
jgi:hypothetical protein